MSREVNVGSEHKLVNVPAHVEPMSPVCGEGGGDVSITILASVVIGRDDARVLCIELERCQRLYRATASTIRPTYAAWMLHIHVCESGWLEPPSLRN